MTNMKAALKVACVVALGAVIYYVAPVPEQPLKVIHVKTAPGPGERLLGGLPCVESSGKFECFLAVTK
jgi:hypothetical protein